MKNSLKIVFVIKPVRPTEKHHLKDYLPKNVLVFEDAVIGVEAAQKAEMNIVMVNNMIDFDKVREENKSLGSQPTVCYAKPWRILSLNSGTCLPMKIE